MTKCRGHFLLIFFIMLFMCMPVVHAEDDGPGGATAGDALSNADAAQQTEFLKLIKKELKFRNDNHMSAAHKTKIEQVKKSDPNKEQCVTNVYEYGYKCSGVQGWELGEEHCFKDFDEYEPCFYRASREELKTKQDELERAIAATANPRDQLGKTKRGQEGEGDDAGVEEQKPFKDLNQQEREELFAKAGYRTPNGPACRYGKCNMNMEQIRSQYYEDANGNLVPKDQAMNDVMGRYANGDISIGGDGSGGRSLAGGGGGGCATCGKPGGGCGPNGCGGSGGGGGGSALPLIIGGVAVAGVVAAATGAFSGGGSGGTGAGATAETALEVPAFVTCLKNYWRTHGAQSQSEINGITGGSVAVGSNKEKAYNACVGHLPKKEDGTLQTDGRAMLEREYASFLQNPENNGAPPPAVAGVGQGPVASNTEDRAPASDPASSSGGGAVPGPTTPTTSDGTPVAPAGDVNIGTAGLRWSY
jgi:hypothetical protein